MEKLLHYVWQHKLFPISPLNTEQGECVEVIDPGLHNTDSGPDFFNAKVKIGNMLWVGNVEIHEHASDWFRHKHEVDPAYQNVILHVVEYSDCEIPTHGGQTIPQIQLSIPEFVRNNYRVLIAEDEFPPCYKVIPGIPLFMTHSWLNALTAERLEEKTKRIERWLQLTEGDWERTFFITLARNFGFGTNSEAFEIWANTIPTTAIAKHRDDEFQIEAIFMGQAGLLNDQVVSPAHRDSYYRRLQTEYSFLAHKFSLTPMDAKVWRFLRLRPQNFPYIRLAQLVNLYCSRRTDLSHLLETDNIDALLESFRVGVTPYWKTHYVFGEEGEPQDKILQIGSQRLLIINTVVPLLFAYGRFHMDENLCERSFDLLTKLPAERNFITKSWGKAGVVAENAADSQALIQLRRNYCDRKDCLRCRFGCEYLKRPLKQK